MRREKNIRLACLALLLAVAPIVAPRATPLGENTLRLPFESYHGLIFLTARVNGSEPLSFILDTGASLTVINEPRAAALGLTLRDKRTISGHDGGEGSMNFAFAKGVAIDLGDARFAPDQVGVTSFALAEKFLGHPKTTRGSRPIKWASRRLRWLKNSSAIRWMAYWAETSSAVMWSGLTTRAKR